MDPDSTERLEVSGDLRDYLRPLRRHVLSIILCGLVFLVAAFVLVKADAEIFQSQANVLVGAGIVGNVTFDSSAKLDLVTEQNVVTSTAVAEPARERMGSDDPVEALLAAVAVANVRDSKVLAISYTSSDPELAKLGAQSFADAYLENRTLGLTSELEARRAQLDAQVTDLESGIAGANDIVAQTEPNSSAQNAAVSRRDALQAQIKSVNDALFALDGTTVQPGSVINPAALPTAPQNNPDFDRLVLLLGALAVGLVVGAASAFARDALDRRIASSDAIQDGFGVPVIGVVPVVRRWRKAAVPPLVVGSRTDLERSGGGPRQARVRRRGGRMSPDAIVSEDFLALRAAFLFAAERSDARVILVTSARDGEGKSTVAANLAAGLAALDRDVILISADLWAPSVHATFGLADSPGLVDAIIADLPLTDVLKGTAFGNLEVIPSRPSDVHEADLIGSPVTERLLAEARTRAHHVIIDGPPLVVADSLTLARLVDGVILVVDAGTRRDVFARAVDKLEATGATVLAAVLNRFEPKRSSQDTGAYHQEIRRRRKYVASPSTGGAPVRETVTSSIAPEPDGTDAARAGTPDRPATEPISP